MFVDTLGLIMGMWIDGNWNNYTNGAFVFAQDFKLEGLYQHYNLFHLGGFCYMVFDMWYVTFSVIIFPIWWTDMLIELLLGIIKF